MLNVCQEYANKHIIQFSTDPNTVKCKTKYITFLHRQRELDPMVLCGNNLPWVGQFKYLGNNIVNSSDNAKQVVSIKRAVTKNNELYFLIQKQNLR